jgi:hypothetical protein
MFSEKIEEKEKEKEISIQIDRSAWDPGWVLSLWRDSHLMVHDTGRQISQTTHSDSSGLLRSSGDTCRPSSVAHGTHSAPQV